MRSLLASARPGALRDVAPSMTWEASNEHDTRVLDEEFAGQPIDCEFAMLQAAYRSTGGIAHGDDLARLLADHPCGDFVSLARLIISGEIFGFERHETFWVPMFQFDLRDLSIRGVLQKVFDSLPAKIDGWILAVWFAQRNHGLNHSRPVDLLDSNLPAVMEAARADFIVAAG